MTDSEPHTDPREELRATIFDALMSYAGAWEDDPETARESSDAAAFVTERLLASEQFTIGLRGEVAQTPGGPSATAWNEGDALARLNDLRATEDKPPLTALPPTMTEERSCEEAPIGDIEEAFNDYCGGDRFSVGFDTFACGFRAGARTPTLPADAREDEARRRSAILLAFASEHHKAHGTAERVEALTWALDTLASGEDIRTWPAGDRPPAEREGG